MNASEPVIFLCPLSEIDPDDSWNTRSGAWHENSADPSSDDGGYEALKASMKARGINDDPILLRPFKTRDHEYLLVDGFRRRRVATELGWPALRATSEPMSDFEARRRNILAGTSRERFKPADLAWAVADLKRLGGPRLTDAELGTAVGISGIYAGVLRRIMQDVDPKVTSAWRSAVVKVDVAELQRLTVMPRDQHWAKWEEILLDKQTRPHGSSKATAWIRLEMRCREKGKELGALERIGFLTVNPVDWKAALVQLIKPREGADVEKLIEAMQTGYHDGLSGKDEKT